MKKDIFVYIAFFLFLSSPAWGYESAGKTGYPEASFEEKTGGVVPGDAAFFDEEGQRVTMKELTDKPAILTLVYYGCRDVCPQLLGRLAETLDGVALNPGTDYRVITVSIDEADTPGTARRQKANYLPLFRKPIPAGAWTFLTGDAENIRKLSDSVGIRYKKTSHGFIHPEVLIFLSPGGVITKYIHVSRYSYGSARPLSFSPVEISDAIADASKVRIGRGSGRSPLYCSVESAGRRKYLFALQITGALTLLLIIGFFLYLKLSKRPSQTKG